ncbi:hypothetical protein [Ralstonia pickettii]|nr:hypothetical protein [Ralstonia pickettii]
MAILKHFRRFAVLAALAPATLTTSGCTAVIGASLRYATATTASTETYVVDGEPAVVLSQLNALMRGGDKVTQLSSNMMVANINEETYRYTMSVTPSQAQPGKSNLQLKVELTGDWEGRGWHSCKDESQAFMKRYSEKTGSVAVLASTK